MAMRRLALVVPPATLVYEIKETENDDFGNPGGCWHDVTDYADVEVLWTYEDGAFHPPPPPALPSPLPEPSVADLKRQLDALAAQIERLTDA